MTGAVGTDTRVRGEPSSLELSRARRRKTNVKEYTGEVPDAACLCATNATLKRMPLEDLRELVEVPLDDDVQCLELDETVKVSVGDSEPTHEASAEPNLFELCLARRRKTTVKFASTFWSDTVSATR